MPFGSRKARAPEPEDALAPEPAPPAALPSAADRWNALLAEQGEIHATLAEHRERRAQLLREDAPFDAIRALAAEDDGLKLRLEQLALRFADLERELEQERREAFEAAWQTHRPVLAAAEAELVQAIRTFHQALEHANAVHVRARGFGERLREFATPPPPAPVYNDWSMRQYLAVAERRQQQLPGAAPGSTLELTVEQPLRIPPDQRFVPRRVPVAELEGISGLAPPRHVRILHGPVKTANLNIGIARMHPGEEHIVSARAAHALVGSGCAEYLDQAATAAA